MLLEQQEVQDQFRLGAQEELAELHGKKGVEAWILDLWAAGQGVETSLTGKACG